MKIILFGDSITDAGRDRSVDYRLESYGHGYPKFVAGELLRENPTKYEILNRGISGHRIVDLYARIKVDVWNLQPDVLSILDGINDIEFKGCGNINGVDIVRFEKIYRMLIEDTLERLPNIKIILCEPFILKTAETEAFTNQFWEVAEYSRVVKSLAEEYGLYFLPLQDKLNEAAEKYSSELYLVDGVHPTILGAKLIAEEWLKLFKTIEQ